MWWLLLSTLANAGPYYESDELRLTWLGDRDDMRPELVARMKAAGLHPYVQGSDGSVVPVKKLRKEVSLDGIAAGLLLLVHQREGAEVDVFVGRPDLATRPVTVRWDEPDRLVFLEGEPVQSFAWTITDPAALLAEYRIGSLGASGVRAWDGYATGLLADALASLSEAERERLDGVHFVRSAGAPAAPGGRVKDAEYREADGLGVVDLFDAAIQPSTSFIGEPAHPHRMSYEVLLHEIGHAIAASYRRRASLALIDLVARDDVLRARYAELVAQLDSVGPKREAAVIAEMEGIVAESTRLGAAMRRIGNVVSTSQLTPAAVALAAALGSRPSPTLYGRTSPEESYAECFALYHADRAALLRAAPEAVAFFDGGGHLAALDEAWVDVEAVLAEVSPPPPPATP